jgi:hypothetical protein
MRAMESSTTFYPKMTSIQLWKEADSLEWDGTFSEPQWSHSGRPMSGIRHPCLHQVLPRRPPRRLRGGSSTQLGRTSKSMRFPAACP